MRSRPVTLHYDLAAASNDDTKTVGGFDAKGNALPAEMLPARFWPSTASMFQLAPAGTGKAGRGGGQGPDDRTARRDNTTACTCWPHPRMATRRPRSAPATKTDELTSRGLGRLHRPVGHAPVEAASQRDHRPWQARPRRLRQDWAVSANHATWDLADRGSPDWSPRYPEDFLGCPPASSSAPTWPGTPRTTTRRMASTNRTSIRTCSLTRIDLPAERPHPDAARQRQNSRAGGVGGRGESRSEAGAAVVRHAAGKPVIPSPALSYAGENR